MTHAYSELYVEQARRSFGVMLDVAVNELHHDLREFYDIFLVSEYSKKFGMGEVSVVAGRSGTELACDILNIGEERRQIVLPVSRSREYWIGWALAYYQWYSGVSFHMLDKEVPIEVVQDLYFPYHEMDILQFVDKMDALRDDYRKRSRFTTYLQYFRKNCHMTQKELALQTHIPLKTIQQYEQGQKSINKAQAEYVIRLAKVLHCAPEQLLEVNH